MQRAFYSASIADFAKTSTSAVLDTLLAESAKEGFPPRASQIGAWEEEIKLLRAWADDRVGSIYFEYTIPRMGRRVDVVLLVGPAILVVEFKVGSEVATAASKEQVWDYALDLKNFHSTSHDKVVVPILVTTGSVASSPPALPPTPPDGLWVPIGAAPLTFASVVGEVLARYPAGTIDGPAWESGRYSPTPTIIEAARALYNNHSVADISRSEAGATNLSQTSESLQRVIESARSRSEKAICLVTGVPGAGKTLVGLNTATRNLDRERALHSVYLSGNGPLVQVLREALARDKVARSKERGEKLRLGESRTKVKTFIQNVHNFRDECIKDVAPPVEHVAIFDEAQRAWDKDQTSRFMRRRKGLSDFDMSEPEFLLSCMDRHPDWSVVVCLVGGGQEIHTGEGGMSEWIHALNRSFPTWRIYSSEHLGESEPKTESLVQALRTRSGVTFLPELHLASSVRSFRAESISALVKSVLDLDTEAARKVLPDSSRYPIALTRDLRKAKEWLRTKARGSERSGIVVSSSAERLKPHAIDVRSKVDPVHWFLDPKEDTRASSFLEDAATEFQVQGLELDWACVAWDADLRFDGGKWRHWAFSGSSWNRVNKPVRQQFLENAYRVLLTRARQGMVIVVPEGDPGDPTRNPAFYDPTYGYLQTIGFQVLA